MGLTTATLLQIASVSFNFSKKWGYSSRLYLLAVSEVLEGVCLALHYLSWTLTCSSGKRCHPLFKKGYLRWFSQDDWWSHVTFSSLCRQSFTSHSEVKLRTCTTNLPVRVLARSQRGIRLIIQNSIVMNSLTKLGSRTPPKLMTRH